MILAAPLVIPFAEAIGLSVAVLGMAKIGDEVNKYIESNPEESAMILKTLVPNLGIGEIFMNKEDSGDDEEVSEEEVTESGSTKDMVLEELNKEKGNYSDPEAKGNYASPRGRIIGRLRREGKIRQGNDPNYDPSKKYQGYKRFIRPKKADGGAIGIEVLFEEKKPRKDFSIGGQARPTDRVYDPRANVEDFTKALKSVSAGTTYQQQRQAQDYARQDASRRLSEAMRSGNQSGIQSIFQGVGGPTSMGGMQFNRSGNRITSVPATGPGRDKIINAMAQQMLNYTPSYQSLKPQPRDNLGLLMQDTIITDQMKSPAEMDAIRDRVLAAQKAQEQSYFMTDPVTGKKYSTEAEAIDDLGLVTYNQRFADGGRVGLFMGGDPLTGQALSIYDSMKAYNFSDQEIANALSAQGLYTAPGSSTPETTQPNIIGAQLNQGGDGRVTELQETFTKDLSSNPRFNYLEPTAQANKYKFDRSVEPRDGLMGFFDKVGNKFKESKFFQPKIRGTLGTRLANQPKLPIPSFASFLSNYTSPFNMKSKSYNPLLESQLNFAETQEGIIGRDSQSGLLRYGPESVLSGKNVVSMFGTNDYEKMLQDYITKMNAYQTKKATDSRAVKIAKAEAELKALQAKTEAARAAQYGKTDYGRGSDGQRSYSGDAIGAPGLGFGIGATTGGPVSNRTGRGRQDYSKGGLVTMFKEKR